MLSIASTVETGRAMGMIDSFLRNMIDIFPLALKIAFAGIFVSWLLDKAFDDRS